jgi:exodeoxyribonuclease VII small subunit
MSAKRAGQEGPERGFEECLARLEKIVSEMEGGSLDLEKTVHHFEEGQALIKYCAQKLNEVERRIEKLVRRGDEIVAEPFPESPGRGGEETGADGRRDEAEDSLDDLPFGDAVSPKGHQT